MRPLPALALLAVLGAATLLLWPVLTGGDDKDLVLYCSVDQDQFKPIVAEFEKATGLRVASVGETEASRSVGMARKVEFERENPVADVFWGNEIMNTVVLRDLHCFAPLPAGVAEEFPAAWRDPKGRYIAFAGRARILLVNREILPDPATWPTSVADLLDPRWGGSGRRACVAAPLTGTTYTHAVALFSRDAAEAEAFWRAVADRAAKGEVKVVPSNGAVKQQVSDAKNGVAFGLTDTDDAREAILAGKPVAVVYPDQADGRPGALVIPNTVALIARRPHGDRAGTLLRWLVSKENEARLAASPVGNVPLREGVPVPDHVKRPGVDFRPMEVDWAAVGRDRDRWQGLLQNLFAGR